jgi:hypothetical protein
MIEKSKKRTRDFDDFRLWLAGLDMKNPTVHVNGASHTGAVLAVDFGTPLTEQKLTAEQSAELVTRMRSATKTLFQDKDINVRVQNDNSNGIYWTSVG